tara:strand:- start:42362 stop:42961 length:600 start_codon:yes stop_codon:yes gene_type:complete
MKKAIILIALLTSTTLLNGQESNYVYKSFKADNVKIKQDNSPIIDESTSELTLNSITDSTAAIGSGYQLYDQFIQENFSGFSQNYVDELIYSEHTSFVVYHSDDLYIKFNKNLWNGKDETDYTGTRPAHLVSSASFVKNTNNINLGDYFIIRGGGSLSGVFFSNSHREPWCFPIHGRYSGGSCFSGSRGLGDWKVYIKK